MPNSSLPQVPFNQIAKHPVTYALVVVVALLGYVARGYTGATDQSINNCKEENNYLRQENRQLRSDKDALVQAILVKNGIINEIKKNTDSLVRERVGNEAKKIITK